MSATSITVRSTMPSVGGYDRRQRSAADVVFRCRCLDSPKEAKEGLQVVLHWRRESV